MHHIGTCSSDTSHRPHFSNRVDDFFYPSLANTDEAGAVDKGVDGGITRVTQARLGEVGEAAKAAQARRSTRGRETK